MGVITRNAANNITTGGVILPAGINNTSVASISELEQVATGGGLNLISSQTASDSASIEFTTGLDSTYDIYKFEWINVRPSEDGRSICIQANNSGGSGFNQTITSTIFRAFHNEADSVANLSYDTGRDQAQGTGLQAISFPNGNGADESTSGEIYLFGISSTTFVKHFIATSSDYEDNSASMNTFTAGYFNTTNALDEFKFAMNSGNIADGTIRLYGIQSS